MIKAPGHTHQQIKQYLEGAVALLNVIKLIDVGNDQVEAKQHQLNHDDRTQHVTCDIAVKTIRYQHQRIPLR